MIEQLGPDFFSCYDGDARTLDFQPDPEIVISGDRELKLMKAQRKKHGRFLY